MGVAAGVPPLTVAGIHVGRHLSRRCSGGMMGENSDAIRTGGGTTYDLVPSRPPRLIQLALLPPDGAGIPDKSR